MIVAEKIEIINTVCADLGLDASIINLQFNDQVKIIHRQDELHRLFIKTLSKHKIRVLSSSRTIVSDITGAQLYEISIIVI